MGAPRRLRAPKSVRDRRHRVRPRFPAVSTMQQGSTRSYDDGHRKGSAHNSDDSLNPNCRARHTDTEWIPVDPAGPLLSFYDLCGWCFPENARGTEESLDVETLLRSENQHGRHLHRPDSTNGSAPTEPEQENESKRQGSITGGRSA